MKYQEDKGLEGFLTSFYNVTCTFAKSIPYDGFFQESLIRLIVELRKLRSEGVRNVRKCATFLIVLSLTLFSEEMFRVDFRADQLERDE
jgi:hypothetical protein